MASPIALIVGLGNPGERYAATRHNAGAWFVEALTQAEQLTLIPQTKFYGATCKWSSPGHVAHVFIPSTFMNESGRAVRSLAAYYNLAPEQILVAHDELDLPTGTARLKFDGGHAGHNGLRDIIQQLGSKAFYRLRIGIGHPGDKSKVHDYVLKAPSKTDKQLIETSITEALHVMPDLLAGNLAHAMHQLHSDV